jgi:hypothetical protein
MGLSLRFRSKKKIKKTSPFRDLNVAQGKYVTLKNFKITQKDQAKTGQTAG